MLSPGPRLRMPLTGRRKLDKSSEIDAKEPQLSRQEEAWRIVEEYANALREIIGNFRKMN
jgi:hypothetical protein